MGNEPTYKLYAEAMKRSATTTTALLLLRSTKAITYYEFIQELMRVAGVNGRNSAI